MDKAKQAEGCCKEAVVPMNETCALVCLILNCIPLTSGLGTCISACANGCGPNFKCHTLGVGIAQILLTGLLVGYIWSIIHGIWMYKAKK